MPCLNRISHSRIAQHKGGNSTHPIVQCKAKSDISVQIEISQLETRLGLSCILNESCLFPPQNEHDCPHYRAS